MTPEEVKALRKVQGLTQEKFAKKIGVHSLTVSRWERGEMSPRGMALQALERMARRVAKRAVAASE